MLWAKNNLCNQSLDVLGPPYGLLWRHYPQFSTNKTTICPLVSTPGWIGVHPHCLSGPSLTAERVWLPPCPLGIVSARQLGEISVFVPLVISLCILQIWSGEWWFHQRGVRISPPKWNKTYYILHNCLVLQYQVVPKGFTGFFPVKVLVPARVLGHLLPPELPQPELLSFDEVRILGFFS